MVVWGVTAYNHDTSIAVVAQDELKFFKYSKGVDFDPELAKQAIKSIDVGPSVVAWYERPLWKKTRQAYAGQWDAVKDFSVMPHKWMKDSNVQYAKLKTFPHHKSHAAAGFLTSPFDEATIVVMDAIGEWETASIWHGKGTKIKKMWSVSYPNSLGLFYSAYTKLLGFKPIAEEHLLQKLAEQGDSERFYKKIKENFKYPMILQENLHRGVWFWDIEVTDENKADIAAAVQRVFEDQVDWVMRRAYNETRCGNLIYMGGCAMNGKYNQRLTEMWGQVWSIPFPGDPSSAIGAALLAANTRVEWTDELAKHLEIKVK